MPESKLETLIENIILLYLIITKFLQFFGRLDVISFISAGEIEYIDLIISMTGLGYVLYRTSISDIMFGQRSKWLDLSLLFSYFMLIANKFVEFSRNSIGESAILERFFIFIVENYVLIEKIAFYLGGFGLVIIAFYVTFKIKIAGPSILDAVHADLPEVSFARKFFSTYLVMLSFYVVFFNPVMEWFSKVLDAPIVVLALFFYVFKLHEVVKTFHAKDFLRQVSESVENFIALFIGLFHSKRTILLGVAGMLVIHLMADVGAFIVPYVMSTHSSYSEVLGGQHNSLAAHFAKDFDKSSGLEIVFLTLSYFLNTVGIVSLMVFPAFIWYILYQSRLSDKKQAYAFPRALIALFFASLVPLLFTPVYQIGAILPGSSGAKNLLGVDILTSSPLQSGSPLWATIAGSAAVFLITYLLTNKEQLKSILFMSMTVVSVGFFGLYIYNFFISIFWFYLPWIQALLFEELSIFLGIYNSIFLLITLVFYIGGYITFVLDVFRD